jgi:benzoyl-CoA 2,3-epoxidase subunit B
MTSTSAISNEKIPNNVHLSDDKRLQRALEAWQPEFIQWWKDMGPEGFQE